MIAHNDQCHMCRKLARLVVVYRDENGNLIENGKRCVEHGVKLINSLVSGSAYERGLSFIRVEEYKSTKP